MDQDIEYLRTLLRILPLCRNNVTYDHTPYQNGHVPTVGDCCQNALQRAIANPDIGFQHGWLVLREGGRYVVVGHMVNTGVNRPDAAGLPNSRLGFYYDSTPLAGYEIVGFIPDPGTGPEWEERRRHFRTLIAASPQGEFMFHDLVEEAFR